MTYVFSILVIFFGAVLNRARGTRCFNILDSTEAGRGVSMALFSCIAYACSVVHYLGRLNPNIGFATTTAVLTFTGLMVWCSPAWDKYWGEEIGHSPTHSRLYGLMQMVCRQSLITFPIACICFFNEGHVLTSITPFPLLALSYYVYGYIEPENPIGYAEYTNGAIISFMILLATGIL